MSRNILLTIAMVLTFGLIQLVSFADCGSRECGKKDCKYKSSECGKKDGKDRSGECGNKDSKDRPLDKKVLKKIHMIFDHQDELGISDDQLAKIKDLKIALKKDLIQKGADIDIVKVDIRSALYEDKIDLAAVNKLIDQKYESKKSKSKKVVSTLAELKKILTKDQMDKLKDLKRKECPLKAEGSHRGRSEGSHRR